MTNPDIPSSTNELIKVLFVDDEPFVLEAIRRTVRNTFDATFAEGGAAALDLLYAGDETFAVVCTDMRMPGTDGVTVLKAFYDRAPDTTRILLTGQADLETAVAAVNEGNVFRFLLKPTAPDQLQRAIEDAAELRRLRLSERELLEQTLRGSIEALVDTLSLANPLAFARAIRVRALVKRLLSHMDVPNAWEIEVAVMLAQVGAVTLPPELSGHLNRGVPLDREELEMVAALPALADKLLAQIPRLDSVRQIITSQSSWESSGAPIGTKVLVLAAELDTLTARTLPKPVIAEIVTEQADNFGAEVMAAFVAMEEVVVPEPEVQLVKPEHLHTGMALASDVRTRDGLLLVGRGQVINESLLARIVNFSRSPGLEQSTVAVYDVANQEAE